MDSSFIVTSSPHIRSDESTRRIMLDVCIALVPALIASIIIFGWYALGIVVLSMLSAVCSEALCEKLMKRRITVMDGSALVTGMLVGFNLPISVPWWIPVVGSAIAIVLVKQMFGGIGKNFMNPALVARAILLASWMGHMSGGAFVSPQLWGVDSVATATPLVAADTGAYSLWNMFVGNVPGCIGETSKLALIIGAGYLLWRKVISWRIPTAMLGTAFLLFWINSGTWFSADVGSALYQLLSGGLILSAFFMATDYSSSPITPRGQLIFGVGCGIMAFVIRAFNPTYPEGCSYAILFMNLLVPLIDRYTTPKVYGEVKKSA